MCWIKTCHTEGGEGSGESNVKHSKRERHEWGGQWPSSSIGLSEQSLWNGWQYLYLFIVGPPVSVGDLFHDPPQLSETAHGSEPCTIYNIQTGKTKALRPGLLYVVYRSCGKLDTNPMNRRCPTVLHLWWQWSMPFKHGLYCITSQWGLGLETLISTRQHLSRLTFPLLKTYNFEEFCLWLGLPLS